MVKNFEDMFNKLREYKGQFVKMDYYNYGYPSATAGEITEIVDFDHIEIGGVQFPFIGYGKAVKCIKSLSSEVLYENPSLDVCYNRTEPSEVIAAIRKSFGDECANEAQRKYDELLQATRRMKEQAKQIKERYVREGLSVVVPAKADQWLIYANRLTNNYYSAQTIETLVEVMKHIESGVAFEKCDELIYELNSDQIHDVVGAIVYFSKHGEEYKNYCRASRGESFVKGIKEVVIDKKVHS